ncbi:hypothetical protein C0J52_10781 [Blattella germanica]|nr:hypothetical protein C0J52_10781 [Blattella germanica]
MSVKIFSIVCSFVMQRLTPLDRLEVIKKFYQSGSSIVGAQRLFTRELGRNHRRSLTSPSLKNRLRGRPLISVINQLVRDSPSHVWALGESPWQAARPPGTTSRYTTAFEHHNQPPKQEDGMLHCELSCHRKSVFLKI